MPNMELIETKTVGAGGASDITFTSISQNYTDLKLVVSARGQRSSTSDDFKVTINNNTSATYTNKRFYGTGTGTGVDGGSSTGTGNSYSGVLNGDSSTSNIFGTSEFYFSNYYVNGVLKSWATDGASENNDSTAQIGFNANQTSDTNPITIIKIESYNSPTLNEGTVASLYGISKIPAGSPKATGGIVSQDASYWYHLFPFTGTFTPTEAITADILVVAGGGGTSQDSGGGGAGGLLTFTSESLPATSYTATVGAGGTQSTSTNDDATSGSNSQFGALTTCIGGGRARYRNLNPTGGSGAGGNSNNGGGNTTPGSGTTGQGYAGGSGAFCTGGGGGAGGVGGNANGSSNGGAGGIGATSSLINAMAVATGTGQWSGGNYYFAGGGAGWYGSPYPGLGGGGAESSSAPANMGGGAGAYRGNGGSGIIIVRYAK